MDQASKIDLLEKNSHSATGDTFYCMCTLHYPCVIHVMLDDNQSVSQLRAVSRDQQICMNFHLHPPIQPHLQGIYVNTGLI